MVLLFNCWPFELRVVLGELDIEAARWIDVAHSDFQVFELARELQLMLNLQWLLILLSGDVLGRGIGALRGQTKLKWRVPYGRVITKGTGILGLKSAGGREELEEIVGGSGVRDEMEMMYNKEEKW